MKKVYLLTDTFTDDPLPYEVTGFPNDMLADLSWLGPYYPQYQNVGWWPEQLQSPVLGEYERITGYTWGLDKINKVVLGTAIVEPWSPEEIAADKVAKIAAMEAQLTIIAMARLDAFARTRRYESILSAVTYATDPDPEFSIEGLRALNLRSEYWRKIWDTLEAVKANLIPMPATIDDITNLPALTWEEET